MPVPIPASEIAAGDWTESYGTIRTVTEHRDNKTNELRSVDLVFWNGRTEIGVNPEAIFIVEQGGLTDRPPTSTVRPGLENHHGNF